MKEMILKNGLLTAIIATAVVLISAGDLSAAAGTSLLIQQSPTDAGSIAPGLGVHNFDRNSEVTLRAVPRAGYQFVYWIGDVSDPTSSTTRTYLNSPKIVVAVYERIAYESLEFEAPIPKGSPGRGGGAVPSRRRVGGGSGVSPARAIPEFSFASPDITDDLITDPNELPVPDEGDGISVPEEQIQEPATVVLLSLGGALALAKRRQLR